MRTLHDISAERGVIGAIVMESDRVMALAISKGLTADAFHDTRHQVAYRTLLAMHERGSVIDLLTFKTRLAEKGNTVRAGGEDYIMGYLDAIPAVAHVEPYIDKVIEWRKIRSILDCTPLAYSMLDEGGSSSEIAAKLMAHLITHIDCGEGESAESLQTQSLDEFERAKRGDRIGFPSCLSPINEIINGYMHTNMYILGGRPSEGKSTLMHNEVIHKAIGLGVPCAVVSMEMSAKLLREMMAGAIANVSIHNVRNGIYTDSQMERLRRAFDLLSKAPIFINETRMTIDEIVAWATHIKKMRNIGLVALDYIQLIRPGHHSRASSRQELVAEWSANLKEMTKRLGVVGIVLSQLSRGGDRTAESTPPPPSLEAFRDSGCIEQDADGAMLLYKEPGIPLVDFRGDLDWRMEIDIAKNRIGPTGIRPLRFVRRRQRYEAIEDYETRKAYESDPNWTRDLFDSKKV